MRTILCTLTLALALGTAAAANIKAADAVFGPPTKTCFDSAERVGQDLVGYKAHVLAIQTQTDVREEDASLLSTISLMEPQSADTVREMLTRFQIKPRLIYSHSVGTDGKTATMVVRINRNTEDPLRVIEASNNGLFFRGIVSIVGLVPNEYVASLQQDPRVYLVDITGDPKVTDGAACHGYVQHVTWQLYGLTQ